MTRLDLSPIRCRAGAEVVDGEGTCGPDGGSDVRGLVAAGGGLLGPQVLAAQTVAPARGSVACAGWSGNRRSTPAGEAVRRIKARTTTGWK